MLRSSVFGVCLILTLASSASAQQTINGCQILPPDNIWNTPVDTLPVLANSSTMVATIGASRSMHADFGAGTWNGGPIGIPFVGVTATQTKYPATFLYGDESDAGPYAVPLNAPIEGGSTSTGDRHAIAIDTANCILYELYRAFPQASSWQADSGAIFNLTSNTLRTASWTSADAAGLPILPGLVTYDEVQSGEIRHAIRFTVPQTRREYVWPARHYASTLTGAQYPRMGERFRLKAGVDITSYPPDVQVILRAMKKYGIILADNGSAWFISGAPDERWNNSNLQALGQVLGSNFEAVDATVLQIDPNSGAAKQSAVSVQLAPAAISLHVGRPQDFSATVTGATGSVVWSVNGIPGGDTAVGTIDASGHYLAPAAVPTPAAVTIRATSTAAPSASATASVTIIPVLSIAAVTPSTFNTGSFSLSLSGQGFVAGTVVTVNGVDATTTVSSLTSLTASGTMSTAGTNMPVLASAPDGALSNTAFVTVTQAPSVSVSVSPAAATVRLKDSARFTAAVQGSTNTAVTWYVNGIPGGNGTSGTISSAGLYRAPSKLPSNGTATVTAVSAADSAKSASAVVTLIRR